MQYHTESIHKKADARKADASILQASKSGLQDGHPHELGAGSFSRYEGSESVGGFKNQSFAPDSGKHKKDPNLTSEP